jgi:hypothetical protein
MAVKGGDLIHVGNQVLLDRAQTAGPGQVNIPTDTIYELGNYKSVGKTLDIPDLSFPLESVDASAELESMLVGKTFSTDSAGTEYDISTCLPVDVASQYKKGRTDANPFEVEVGVSLPALYLETLSYRFGISENAAQTATLKGDSIFYCPGSVYVQEATGSGTAGQTITLTNDAYPYKGDVVNGTRYALAVTLKSGKRLRYGTDYTEVATVSGAVAAPSWSTSSPRFRTPTRSASPTPPTPSPPTRRTPTRSPRRPGRPRSRAATSGCSSAASTSPTSGPASSSSPPTGGSNLDRDLEFGNSEVVSQDYEVPTVNGSIDLKPRNATELYTKIAQIAGAATVTEVVGALQQAVLPLDIVLYSPTDGSVLKTLYIEDARFTRPGLLGPRAAEADRDHQLRVRPPATSRSTRALAPDLSLGMGIGGVSLLGSPAAGKTLRALGPGGSSLSHPPPADLPGGTGTGRNNMARRLRQVTDLYVTGTGGRPQRRQPGLGTGTQPLRVRTPLATRRRSPGPASRWPSRSTAPTSRPGSACTFFEDGIDSARARVVDAKVAEVDPQDSSSACATTPEWSEKLD